MATRIRPTPPLRSNDHQEKEHLADALDALTNHIAAVRDALDDASTHIEWALKKLAEEFEAFTWEGRRK